jgi:cell division protein FtsZ
LLNIISGSEEVTMSEIGEIIDYLQDEAGQDATIIWGNGTDLKLDNQISVTIIATGFDVNPNRIFQPPVEMVELLDEDNGFDITIDDEAPKEAQQPVIPKAEPVWPQQPQPITSKNKLKKEKDKRFFHKQPGVQNASDDGWFARQFNRFFDDKESSDTSISEDMKE